MTYQTRKEVKEPTVQLFILSRNRKQLCREAVASALAQDFNSYEVIVSDNSTSEDVADMIESDFPSVRVIRRRPCLPALDHFNKLIEEATAQYTVLFHDDDTLHPNYISRIVQRFSEHVDVAAIGSNAYMILDEMRTPEPLMGNFKGIKLINQVEELLQPYMGLSLIDPAPFPGYMYRTEKIKGLSLNVKEGGKHSDVAFLCHILSRAPLIWIDECLFNYRIHGGNGSRNESIGDRLCWLRFILKTTHVNRRSKMIRDYKFIYWRRWLKQNYLRHRPNRGIGDGRHKRYVIGSLFVLKYGFQLVFSRLDFWRRTWRLLRRRWLY